MAYIKPKLTELEALAVREILEKAIVQVPATQRHSLQRAIDKLDAAHRDYARAIIAGLERLL